jgi:hypothetical protein
MSNECTVAISVVKANKNPPKFLRDEYSSPVPDTALFGQKIIQLTAVDADLNAVDSENLQDVSLTTILGTQNEPCKCTLAITIFFFSLLFSPG